MTMKIPPSHGVILVGHGAIPKDYPRDLVTKLKALEANRRVAGGEPTSEETELDMHIRRWPRTPETDPYQSGLEALAAHLKVSLNGTRFAIAYNEFCGPTIEEAVEDMIAAGVRVVTVIPSMLTRAAAIRKPKFRRAYEGSAPSTRPSISVTPGLSILTRSPRCWRLSFGAFKTSSTNTLIPVV